MLLGVVMKTAYSRLWWNMEIKITSTLKSVLHRFSSLPSSSFPIINLPLPGGKLPKRVSLGEERERDKAAEASLRGGRSAFPIAPR